MKKRLKHKLQKRMNEQRHEQIFKELSPFFTVTHKQFGNGYFLFKMGKSAVCHFELKETPDWHYGIWLHVDGFDLFGEHDNLIDKFKPTRTYVSHQDDVKNFIEQVQNIAQNPKLYFVDSLTDGRAFIDYQEGVYENGEAWQKGYQIKREYNEGTKRWDIVTRDTTITQEAFVEAEFKEFYEDKQQKKENEELDRKNAFQFFKELPNLFEEIKAVGITDKDKGAWKCYPRYHIRLIVSPEIQQSDLSDLFDSVTQLVNDKTYSKEKKTHEHGFYFNDCFDDMRDIKACDYKYVKKERNDKYHA